MGGAIWEVSCPLLLLSEAAWCTSPQRYRDREMKRETQRGLQFPLPYAQPGGCSKDKNGPWPLEPTMSLFTIINLECPTAVAVHAHPKSPGCSRGSYRSDRLWGSLCHCHGSKSSFSSFHRLLSSLTFLFSQLSLPENSPHPDSCLKRFGELKHSRDIIQTLIP